jgi:hypothetical protein
MSQERERPSSDAGQSQAEIERPGADQSEEIWLLDIGSPEFADEARRQSLLVANSPFAKDDMASDPYRMSCWRNWTVRMAGSAFRR